MNSYNKSFQQRVIKVSAVLQHLNKIGCAITELAINDTGSVINILPPPNKKLIGQLTNIVGDQKGKHLLMQARINGCTVRWQATPTN